ncbi:MAG: hypothetical protein KGH71_05245 [Candidatus Micrarchaeota archaeon]|nr:hypothetical protein [Candidatus Micrarchaeota archaeon]
MVKLVWTHAKVDSVNMTNGMPIFSGSTPAPMTIEHIVSLTHQYTVPIINGLASGTGYEIVSFVAWIGTGVICLFAAMCIEPGTETIDSARASFRERISDLKKLRKKAGQE